MSSLSKLDLNLFVIFNEIYKERSVTKVAAKLNITQPAVSNSLSRLRSNFDDQLFVKTPSGMQPTPTAEATINDVRRALALLEKSVNGNLEFNPKESNKALKLAMGDLAGTILLPKLINTLKTEAPQVSIANYYRDRDAAVSDLIASKSDFLIDAPAFNAKEFDQESLLTTPYVVVMSPKHSLATKKLTLKNYLDFGHIHVSSRQTGAGQADIALHARGYQRTIKFRTPSYLIAARMVQDTDLIWTAPKAIIPFINSELLSVKPPFKIDPLILNLYWRKSTTNDPSQSWFRHKIKGVFKELNQ